MKFKLDRTAVLKIVCLIILIVAIFMGAAELVLLVDLGGLDFAVTFLLVYFASIRDNIVYRYRAFKSNIKEAMIYFSALFIFQPKVFVSHASASGLLIAFTCSVFLACLLWVPLIYLSSGFIS